MSEPTDSTRSPATPPQTAPVEPDGRPRWHELRTGWRRRLPFYLLMGIGVLLFVQFFDRRPREIDVFFVLSQLDVATELGRLDRRHLVELNAEIREGGELRAMTTWTFRDGAPLKVGPARVRLRSGEYDVHFRLTFVTAQGDERLFALRRRIAVEDASHVLVDVTG